MGSMLELKCDGKCFNCKFKDCRASYQEIDFFDRQERKKIKLLDKKKEVEKYNKLA